MLQRYKINSTTPNIFLKTILGVPLRNIIINGMGSSKLSKRGNYDGGLLIASWFSTGATVTEVVPYFVAFEKTIFNHIIIKRTTGGGQVDIVDDNNEVMWTYISIPFSL